MCGNYVLLVWDSELSDIVPVKVIGEFLSFEDAVSYFMTYFSADSYMDYYVKRLEYPEEEVIPLPDALTEEEWNELLARAEIEINSVESILVE